MVVSEHSLLTHYDFLQGVFTAREIARFCRVVIESTLGKPKLIRETSRKSLPYQYLTDLINWARSIWTSPHDVQNTRTNLDQIFADVALPMSLKDRVLNLATAASRSKDNNAPQRHILFYGPPGTGKTRCFGFDRIKHRQSYSINSFNT